MAHKNRNRRANSPPISQPPQPSRQPVSRGRSLRHATTENELIASILIQLPYHDLSPQEANREVIFARYIDSLAKLDVCRQQLVALGTALAMASITYESPLPENVQSEIQSSILSDFHFRLDAPANIAGADLGALPVDEIREFLAPALIDACRNLVTQFFDGLAALHDRQLLGFAHWPGQNAIKYHYYRYRVSGHAAVTTTTATRLPDSVEADFGLGSRVTKTLQREVQSIPVTITLECHQHDAIDAYCTGIENSTVVMPPNVKALIEAIPAWMRPSIRVVDGYLIRERINQKKVQTTSVITDVQEEVFTEYSHGIDPVVLLGSIVLTGWGPKEIEVETKAEEERQIISQARKACIFWGAGALCLQLVVVKLGKQILGHPVIPILAMAAFAASIFILALSLRNFYRWKKTQVKEWQIQRILATTAMAYGGLHIMALPGTWLWPVIGFFLTCVGSYLLIKSLFTSK